MEVVRARKGIRVVHKNGATIRSIGEETKAAHAMNFNFANNETGVPIGRLIVDGKTVVSDVAKTANRNELYMLPSGEWWIGRAPAGAVYSAQGSPLLVDMFTVVWRDSVEHDKTDRSVWAGIAYRVATGIMPGGEVIFAKSEKPVSMEQWAQAMKALGCVKALNGDGGGSAVLWSKGDPKTWGRLMGSAIVIEEGYDMNTDVLLGDANPLLVIDPGHGGSDPGATNPLDHIIEKDLTLAASLTIASRLREHGVKVAMTRTTDKTLPAAVRAKLVKDSGAKTCLSIHVNAGGGDGAEVIHSIHNDGKLANAIAAGIKAAGQNVRRVFCRSLPNDEELRTDYYYMHRDTGNVSTQIVELFFLDSKATGPDADLVEYKTEFDGWVEGVVRGYCNHFGITYKPLPAKPPVTPPPVKPKPVGIFSDVPGDHWSAGAIEWADKIDLIEGKPDGTLGFGEAVTIERQLVLMQRLYNIIKGGK
jgi:N-acetylmuramoyl-L-alanine amidase